MVRSCEHRKRDGDTNQAEGNVSCADRHLEIMASRLCVMSAVGHRAGTQTEFSMSAVRQPDEIESKAMEQRKYKATSTARIASQHKRRATAGFSPFCSTTGYLPWPDGVGLIDPKSLTCFRDPQDHDSIPAVSP